MSFDALAWAARQNTGSAGSKLILLGLAECASRPDALAWPSIEALREFSSLNRKTIITNLALLEAAGMIADTGERRGRTRQIKVYKLAVWETVPILEQSRFRNSSENASERVPKTGHGISKGTSQLGIGARGRDMAGVIEGASCLATLKPDGSPLEFPESVTGDGWADFVEMRRSIRKPITAAGVRGIVRELWKLLEAPGSGDASEILEQSVVNNWAGVFPLKNGSAGRGTGNSEAAGTGIDGVGNAMVRAGLRAEGARPDFNGG